MMKKSLGILLILAVFAFVPVSVHAFDPNDLAVDTTNDNINNNNNINNDNNGLDNTNDNNNLINPINDNNNDIVNPPLPNQNNNPGNNNNINNNGLDRDNNDLDDGNPWTTYIVWVVVILAVALILYFMLRRRD